MARVQNTPARAGDRLTDHLPPILEPELEGEIAARRQLVREGARGVRAHTIPGPAGPTEGSSRAAVAPDLVEVGEFERIEDYLRAYLEGERFRSAHPLACGRWVVAWEMLWCAESRAKVIAVGHRASAAMQAFTASMLERCMAMAMDPNWPELLAGAPQRSEPEEGLLTITEAYRRELGEERFMLLRSLLDDWPALLERVQRHEHGSPAGGERLRWEDGRRLVLFTALVMVETDRSFA